MCRAEAFSDRLDVDFYLQSTFAHHLHAYVQILLDRLGYLSLVGSGRVVREFHYMDPTRPHPRTAGSPTSPRTLSGRRLVRSISTCTDSVRGSGLVGWQTKSVGPCSGIWKRHDQTRRATKSDPVRAKFHYTRTRIGPDPTRQSPRTCRKPARTHRTLSETRTIANNVSIQRTRQQSSHGCSHCRTFSCIYLSYINTRLQLAGKRT